MTTAVSDWVINRALRWLPDRVTEAAIQYTVYDRVLMENKRFATIQLDHDVYFRELLKQKYSDIAVETEAANHQHYTVPTEFFQLIMGARMKYSCCEWTAPDGSPIADLTAAEENTIDKYCRAVELHSAAEPLRVLDLGCGWGSFTLFAAEKYPRHRYVAVSNSPSQRAYINAAAAKKGLNNITVITCNINHLAAAVVEQATGDAAPFDAIVSIEMFEHVKRYDRLLATANSLLRAETGKLFVHMFVKRATPYEMFDHESWMAKHFFSGGTFLSETTLPKFVEDSAARGEVDLSLEQSRKVNGSEYGKTSYAWLRNHDINRDRVIDIFSKHYTDHSGEFWFNMWRLFFLGVAVCFNYGGGDEWFVMHYLFRRGGQQEL